MRPGEKGSCLKHRVERFSVEGGTYPLPTPHEAKESGGWGSIDFGREIRPGCSIRSAVGGRLEEQ